MTTRIEARAKLNLALVVGPARGDGKHELVTVYQRLALHDDVELRPASSVDVAGFADDTLVRRALEALVAAGGPTLAARIAKRIPVAAGLGGGSADAAAALRLGNDLATTPLPESRLAELAARLGADVPFCLSEGPQLGSGDGTILQPLDLPQDYVVLLVLPNDASKTSTADVYAAFDRRSRGDSFAQRRGALLAALEHVRTTDDLASLPRNDLASSSLADELHALGAFRADVTGAGPAVYALFRERSDAELAERRVGDRGHTWITTPAW
ncbi:MAG TPA: hypothetical protein VEH52_07405 [Gaiellaceae bacterium]|nr:hypothetical protein [Gaiellaceae bacterium]